LSDKCEQFFIEESCFYECDKNLGKWRNFADCKADIIHPVTGLPDDNEWQIKDMPIKVGRCGLTQG